MFICGGVTIGDNSIIEANSVVQKNIPPDSIYGGLPGRLIGHKRHVDWEEADQGLPGEMIQESR